MEMVTNYFYYKVFNVSRNKRDVVVGVDNFLFLGNRHGSVIDKTRGAYKYNLTDIHNWTDKLKKIQLWYENRGIKFVIVMAPNKHSVYKEKLPDWMKYNGKTITDDIVKLSHEKNINMLDLRNSLKASKKDNILIYTKGESHWNNIGASIAYDNTINFINKKYKNNIQRVKYRIMSNKRGKSPLSVMLKMKNPFNHEDNVYKIKTTAGKIEIVNIDKKTFDNDGEHKIIKNKNIWSNTKFFLIKNKSALNNKKLLFLCDSFSATGDEYIGNSILYNQTFRTIFKLDYHHIKGHRLSNFVAKHKPNIVIYQIVERNLYNNSIVAKLPDIHIDLDNND